MTAVEFLRRERRSYIIGTLVAMFAAVFAIAVLWMVMAPELRSATSTPQLFQMIRDAELRFTLGQTIALELVQAAGAVGLFMLNWRFSLILRRPRSAFVNLRQFSWVRLGWVVALVADSFLYGMIVPQLALTWLLAHWGSEEIARAAALPPPPGAAGPEAFS